MNIYYNEYEHIYGQTYYNQYLSCNRTVLRPEHVRKGSRAQLVLCR